MRKNKPERIRRFSVIITTTAIITLHDAVIQQEVEKPYILGPGSTEQDVIKHLAYNLVNNKLFLKEIDGWYNRTNEEASTDKLDTDIEFTEETNLEQK